MCPRLPAYLRSLPEGSDIGAAINRAMEAIETENPDLKGVLPRDYARFDNSVLVELLRLIGSIPDDIEGDAFGKIYAYSLGNFAITEGQRGGEFHSDIDRQADRRCHPAVQGAHPRPRLRIRWHVRAVGTVR